jgi:glycosyltransferase involved in cell wall biosynthesis
MRVLHVDTGRELRGGQRQALLLVRALRGRGVESRVLARGPLLDAARREGFEAGEVSVWKVLAWSRRVDVVHCHDARSHTLAWLASRAPVVVSRRVAFPVQKGPFSRKKYAFPARFCAISRAVRDELLRAGVPPEKIRIVPDATLLPGALSARDGPLVAIASDDPKKGGAILRASGLPVVFSADLERDLARARAFLYITESEGLGSAALLAMAHGVPVIASDVGGLKEIVRDGETGLLVRNTPEALRAAVERLERDAGLAGRLAAAGRALVEKEFTVERMAAATLAVYEEAAE